MFEQAIPHSTLKCALRKPTQSAITYKLFTLHSVKAYPTYTCLVEISARTMMLITCIICDRAEKPYSNTC